MRLEREGRKKFSLDADLDRVRAKGGCRCGQVSVTAPGRENCSSRMRCSWGLGDDGGDDMGVLGLEAPEAVVLAV